jgi:hypothetical protein
MTANSRKPDNLRVGHLSWLVAFYNITIAFKLNQMKSSTKTDLSVAFSSTLDNKFNVLNIEVAMVHERICYISLK